jgi:hypothetical protein
MKTRSRIGRMTFAGVAVIVVASVTLFAAGAPSAAQAMSVNQRMSVDQMSTHPGDHHGDRDHHPEHHYGGRPNGIYYIYPYNQYIYRYYSVPTYPTPTYWYYCPSYATYYPYVASCPEAWVPVPAS